MLSMDRKCRNCRRKTNKVDIERNTCKKHHTNIEYINISKYRFEIKEEVINYLCSIKQNGGNELCGVLTGSQINENVIRISKASPPCVKSHSRFTCKRDALLANSYIKEDYENSNHTRVYIGEWHTHPEHDPKPSLVDINSLISNFNTAKLAIPLLIMMIIGIDDIYISVYDGTKFFFIKPIILN